MDTSLSYVFIKNFIYSGFILGVLLSLMDIIKNSKKYWILCIFIR